MTFGFPLLTVPLAIILSYFPHFLRVLVLRRKGKYENANPRDLASQNSSLPENVAALCTRLASCHQNQLEMLGPYAAGIVACVAINVADTGLDVLSGLYIAFRTLYIVAYAAPQVAGGALRSIVFVACMAVVMMIWFKATFQIGDGFIFD